MLDKHQILDSLLHEGRVVKHLVRKLPDGAVHYRPTPRQRTTLELLRYLAMCGIGGTLAMNDMHWDGYKAWEAKTADLTIEEVPAAMDEQADALRTYFSELSDKDFATRSTKTPLGEQVTLARALLEVPVKWMTAYRMQLFLYCKQAGNGDIWTPDCWGGVDRARPTPQA
jgi:hypothetical protein